MTGWNSFRKIFGEGPPECSGHDNLVLCIDVESRRFFCGEQIDWEVNSIRVSGLDGRVKHLREYLEYSPIYSRATGLPIGIQLAWYMEDYFNEYCGSIAGEPLGESGACYVVRQQAPEVGDWQIATYCNHLSWGVREDGGNILVCRPGGLDWLVGNEHLFDGRCEFRVHDINIEERPLRANEG